MAVAGRKPKEGEKRNHMPPTHEWIEVEDTPYDGEIPELPELEGSYWPAKTVAWYEVVSTMPHAILWDAGMWQEIHTTALLHASIWRNADDPVTGRITELRQREKSLGLTADARRDLRIRYVPVQTNTEQTTEAIAKYTSTKRDIRPRMNALGT